MIVGYDIACYSYGSGPCIAPMKGYLKTATFDGPDRDAAMRELMREMLAMNSIYPRVTSISATFQWGDGERIELWAGLLDRNSPQKAPYGHQTEAMAEFNANTWVGEREPTTGISGHM